MCETIEHGKKPEIGSKYLRIKAKLVSLLPVLLRVAAVIATVVATVVMGLNKQTKTTAVAIVGTTPLYQTFTAKFQQTPAFVYFVIANAIASFYNLLVLLLRNLFKGKGHNIYVQLFDMVAMALVATGAAAAASIAELGRNGNLHARWNPICDKFDSFCSHGGMALVASFLGSLLLLILNMLSVVTLCKSVACQE
ncbi:CASP-like protein 1B2 isoform X2 [Typha latifolia]